MGRWRVVLALAGIGLGLYGLGRLLTGVSWSSLVLVGVWLSLALSCTTVCCHRPWWPSARCSAGSRPEPGATCRPD